MLKRYGAILLLAVMLITYGIAQAESHSDAFEFLSPKPGAMYVSKDTYIVIRPGENLSSYSFSYTNPVYIEGEQSGEHTYEVKTALDGKTLNIIPHRPFEPGERVAVAIDNGLKARSSDQTRDFIYHFTVSPKTSPLLSATQWKEVCYDLYPAKDEYPQTEPDLSLNRSDDLPSDFPNITISENNNPSPGYLFMNRMSFAGQAPYIFIINDAGDPIYFQKMPFLTINLRKQPTGDLSYSVANDPMNYAAGTHYIMNSTYTVIDSFKVAGYPTGIHDLQLTTDGRALMMSYDPQPVDMSAIVPGGDSLAIVLGAIVQVQDSLGAVVAEWRSWDHMLITDAIEDFDLTGSVVDYAHPNAVAWDSDGNLLLSCRHTDEVTKIDYATGTTIWRMGGKLCENNMFTFINDPDSGFTHQHDIRRLDNGNITLFDNGVHHEPPHSRGVEYELDEVAMTATLVWEFRDSPDIFASVVGSVQRFDNGNTLVNWGSALPIATEVNSGGTKEWELSYAFPFPMEFCYRTLRYPWTGIASRPYLVAEQTDQGIHLVFYKFGDLSITEYIVYGDETPEPTIAVDTTIENFYYPDDLLYGKTYNFLVTGIDYAGIESGYSNEVEITMPNLYMPGDVNSDDLVIGSDVTFLVNYFRAQNTPTDSCWNETSDSWLYSAADTNGDCMVIGSDVTFLVNYFRALNDIDWCEDTWPYGYEEE